MPRRHELLVAASLVLFATACGGQHGQPQRAGWPTTAPPGPTAAVPTAAGPTPTATGPTDPAGTTGNAASPAAGSTTPPGATTAPGQPTTEPTSEPTVRSDRGRRLTAADDGAQIWLRVGETATLLQDNHLAPDPTVDGDAIELVELVNIAASGDRQWEIRARTPGEAVIRVEDPPDAFVIRVRVTP